MANNDFPSGSNHPPVTKMTPTLMTFLPPLHNEKIVATSSGLKVSFALIEPVLYLENGDGDDHSAQKSQILRGKMHLKASKCLKTKKVSVCFRGLAQTDWPKGTPPNKNEDKKDLITHSVICFNYRDTGLENDYGADYFQHDKPSPPSPNCKDTVIANAHGFSSESGVVSSLATDAASEAKRPSRQDTRDYLQSFSRDELPSNSEALLQHKYRTFPASDYVYSFEFLINNSLPETIKTRMGFVRYELVAIVEQSGIFRPNCLGTMEIPLVRTPAEGSLERVEPIMVSQNWEDQLLYDIVIAGKSFPLGSQIPIALKLTPLAKVVCHRIEVYVTENIHYRTADKNAHRFQPVKKLLLFQKRAGLSSTLYPGSSSRITAGGGSNWDQGATATQREGIVDHVSPNLLGNISSESSFAGSTEMEFNVQLPRCYEMKNRDETERIHFDTTYENIQITHRIMIVLHLSRVNEKEPGDRKLYQISTGSPFKVLSCKATEKNLRLPTYMQPTAARHSPAQASDCSCPGTYLTPSGECVTQFDYSDEISVSNPSQLSFITRPVSQHSLGSSGDLPHLLNAQFANEMLEREPVPRPMHLLRTPSFAPPVFDDAEAPPPLVSPPPDYTSVVGGDCPETVLEDYFSRLSLHEERYNDQRRGFMINPLSPDSRVNSIRDA